ncbi:MAG: ABC transporter permease [Rhodospirillales bacterium]
MENWRNHRLTFGIFILPPTFWLVVFFTAPLAVVWVYSFGYRGPSGQTYLGFSLDNYVRAFDWLYLGILLKSVWIAIVTTAICIVMGLPLAMGISFAPKRWRNILLLIVILPFWTNLLIRTYAWIAVLRTAGYVNFSLEWAHGNLDAFFTFFGMPELMGTFEPLEILYNQKAVVIGLVYVHLPFMVLPLYTVFEKLDRAYLEASLDLGASQWRTFFSVTVPLVMPGIASGTLLVFILSMGTFLTPDLLGGTDSVMIGNLIAQQFGPARNWPFGSAISFVLMYATFLILWARATFASQKSDLGI